MSHSNFSKHKKDIGKDCKQWEAIQKHWYCFHDSHQQPTTWSECGHLRRHVNDALLVMHSRQDVPLPVPMVIGSFMRKVSPNDITTKPFRVDAVLRGEYDSRENRRFADLGYRSMDTKFTSDHRIMLKTLLSKLASCSGIPYHDGRSGHRIGPQKLKEWDSALLRTLFNEELQHAVLHYFAGSRDLVLYGAEVLRTQPYAPTQSRHSDISTGEINDPQLQVSTIRLAVIALISIDGAATTEVYPRTRTDALDYIDRPVVRATQDDNCVLFDARLAHQGAANNKNETNFKLCFVFINAEASKEHLTVVNKCLKRRSMNLRVADLLSGELESGMGMSWPSKRKAELSATTANLTVRRGRWISNEPA
jgi:hypothetical protein